MVASVPQPANGIRASGAVPRKKAPYRLEGAEWRQGGSKAFRSMSFILGTIWLIPCSALLIT